MAQARTEHIVTLRMNEAEAREVVQHLAEGVEDLRGDSPANHVLSALVQALGVNLRYTDRPASPARERTRAALGDMAKNALRGAGDGQERSEGEPSERARPRRRGQRVAQPDMAGEDDGDPEDEAE